MVTNVLINSMVGICSQSSRVHFKYLTILFVNYSTKKKSWGKKFTY